MEFVFIFLFSVLIPNGIVADTSDNGSIPIIYKCSLGFESDAYLPETLVITAHNNIFAKSPSQHSQYSFKLAERLGSLSCSNQTFKVSINSSQETSPVRLSHAGFLSVFESTHAMVIPPEKFCVSKVTSEEVESQACPVKCSGGECLDKCCPPGFVLSNEIGESIHCVKAPESLPLPMLFSVGLYDFPQGNNIHAFQTQPDTETNGLVLGNCEDSPKVKFLENEIVNDVSDLFLTIKAMHKAQSMECVDHHFTSNSSISGNVSWRLAQLSCSQKVGLRLRSGITTSRYRSLYKCSGEGKEYESESFVKIPLSLRINDEKLVDAFNASTGYKYTSFFEFNLVERDPKCTGETFELTANFLNNMTVDNKIIHLNFTPDGHLDYIARLMVNGEEKIDEIYYPRESYCVSRITKDSISVKLCKSTCSHHPNEKDTHICIPKCCFLGAVMTDFGEEGGIGCESPPNGAWTPDIYKNKLTDEKVNVYPTLHFHDDNQTKPWRCNWTTNDTLESFFHETFEYRILSDGRILTRKPQTFLSHLSWEEVFTGVEPMEFCIDGLWDASESYDKENSKTYIHRCSMNRITYFEEQARQNRTEQSVFSTKILLFTVYLPCAFIYLIILLVYGSIWEKQNVQGWTVMAFSMSQFLVYVFIWTISSSVVFGEHGRVLLENKILCIFSGAMYYFFVISTFTWTLILTFDVWAKLSSMTPTSRFYKGTKRFLGYTCFALGVPALAVSISLALDFSFDLDENIIVLPGFRKTCLITGKVSYLVYVVAINTVIFTVNLIFGCLTFKSLWDAKKNVKTLKTKSKSTSSAFENKIALVGKLMMLMGFVLIFEVFFKYTGLREASVWCDVLEAYRLLHAIGLFWIFVCSGKTTKQLQEKYSGSSIWSAIGSRDMSRMGNSSGRDTQSTAAAHSTAT